MGLWVELKIARQTIRLADYQMLVIWRYQHNVALATGWKWYICRIKTGHPFLVEASARRRGRLAKSSYRGERRGKMTCQRPSLRADTPTKIWMNGLIPNHNTARPNSERETVYSASRRHLSFAVPWGVAYNYSRFYFIYLLFICYYIQYSFLLHRIYITADFILFIYYSSVIIFSTHFFCTKFTLPNIVGVFIAATRAIFRPCMELLSARCSSPGGSTWRLQSVRKLLANLTSTSLNIPLWKWKRGPR